MAAPSKTALSPVIAPPEFTLNLPKGHCQRSEAIRRRGAASAPLRRPAPPCHIRICFSYFQNFGSFLALQVDITFETNTLLRHDAAPPLNVISRLTTVFTTYKKRLMSSSQPSPGPPRLPACHPLCYAFHAKGYDGDEYASRNGTASPARWKRTPRRTRNITPEPPAERNQVS